MSDDALIPSWLRQAGPLAKRFYDLYDHVKHERFKSFLKSIGSVSDELSDAERQRFERLVSSDEGQELLTDFADHVVRTRSRTAIAALAVLYASPVTEQYETDFKAEAAQGLEGLSDRSIYAFLTLYSIRSSLTVPQEERSSWLDNGVVEAAPALRALGHDHNAWVRIIEDLIRRGILGRDLSSAGRLSGDATFEQVFTFTEQSDLYWGLLSRARRQLGLPVVGEP